MKYWIPIVAGAIAVELVTSCFGSPEHRDLIVAIPITQYEHELPTNAYVPDYLGIEYGIAATASTSTNTRIISNFNWL